MTRTKVIASAEGGTVVELSDAENKYFDDEEKAWNDGAVKRDAMEEIHRLESTVTPRRIREMTTDDGAKWVDDVEKLIAIERGKL